MVGLILGIVAIATGRSKPMSIVAICLGAFSTFLMFINAAIAIPAFTKYIRRSKTMEATMNVRRLAEAVSAQPQDTWAKLPDSDWTPPGSPCGQPGSKFAPNPSLWRGEPWATLSFSVDEPSYYQYRVSRDADGVVVEARADLDCDSIRSHFLRHVTPGGVGQLFTEKELE
jgi:hypothetical protein